MNRKMLLGAMIWMIGLGWSYRGAAAPGEEVKVPRFVCNTGYTLERCREDMNVLRAVLGKYPTAALGEWTWVLVRSEDWKALLLARHFDPMSPAFTYLPAKQTFLEGALVLPASTRGVELSAVWHMSVRELLDLAIRHELGHAICNQRNEAGADLAAALLRGGKPVSCERDFRVENRFDPIKTQLRDLRR